MKIYKRQIKTSKKKLKEIKESGMKNKLLTENEKQEQQIRKI
jgi:hypothetical protein